MSCADTRGKILIADDDRDVVGMLEEFFAGKRYDVITAYDGRQTIDKLEKQHPDILLLDLRMPEVDGEYILKYIEEKGIDVSVIIITGYPEYIREKRLLERCYDYIIKPFSIDYLNTTVLTKIVLAFNNGGVN